MFLAFVVLSHFLVLHYLTFVLHVIHFGIPVSFVVIGILVTLIVGGPFPDS